MGNSSTKESRAGGQEGGSPRSHYEEPDYARVRNRMSRGDMATLAMMSNSSRDRARRARDPDAPFEHRETRAEREARRLERERVQRAKDREISLREEHVDGGYLVTLGTYAGTEDFNKSVVRQLQIERRLAPFWRGLPDWSDNWAEHQLIAAARGLPIPAADDPPAPELVPQPPPARDGPSSLASLTVPLGPRTMSAASDKSGSGNASPAAGTPKSSSFKPRAKALALALAGSSREQSSTDLIQQEVRLPHDPFVNGQAIEVHLYKDAMDCPICFLSYPPYLNQTRCCDQPICTECFVQIKRADPHLPEHHPDGQARDPNEGLTAEDPPEMLISEPSACPYCQQPEFGVTYVSPTFRRGLSYAGAASAHLGSSTPMSSQSSLHSPSPSTPQAPPAPQTGRRRGHSLSATAPNVITTDRIRPDWSTKLATARAHQARRAAAATALHTAAFLVGGSEQRSILRPGRFARRLTGSGSNTPGQILVDGPDQPDENNQQSTGWNADGSRRTRMDELEDMMMMEAVRLSLAAEEERKRKESKALRKEAKKQQEADKKAAKKASKGPYGGSHSGASGSSLSLGLGRRRGNSGASHLRSESNVDDPVSPENTGKSTEEGQTQDKGKAIAIDAKVNAGEQPTMASGSLPIPVSARGNSHLRQMSNASSMGSSLADTPAGSYSGPGLAGPDGSRSRGEDSDGEQMEPMFNFRSLAELVGVNIEDGSPLSAEGSAAPAPTSLTAVQQDMPSQPLPRVSEESKEAGSAEHMELAPVTDKGDGEGESARASTSIVAASAVKPLHPEEEKQQQQQQDEKHAPVSLSTESTLTVDAAPTKACEPTQVATQKVGNLTLSVDPPASM